MIYNDTNLAFKDIPDKFQTGFRNYVGIAGLESSANYLFKFGMENIRKKNLYLSNLLREELLMKLLVDIKIESEEFEKLGKDGLKEKLLNAAKEFYRRKEEMLGAELMARLERYAVLSVIDTKWKEHLREMDDLKEGIGLRAYGQKDPLVE